MIKFLLFFLVPLILFINSYNSLSVEKKPIKEETIVTVEDTSESTTELIVATTEPVIVNTEPIKPRYMTWQGTVRYTDLNSPNPIFCGDEDYYLELFEPVPSPAGQLMGLFTYIFIFGDDLDKYLGKEVEVYGEFQGGCTERGFLIVESIKEL